MEATKTDPRAAIAIRRLDCRACGSTALTEVLNLGEQELPRFPESAEEVIPTAPLELVQCAGCGLLQLRHTVDPDLLFRSYYYRSSINASMRAALQEIVGAALDYAKEGTWLDIGANDGCLLSQVPETFEKVACEPAADFTDQLQEHAEIVIPDYFSHRALQENEVGKCDIITSAAMFYDLDDPNRFVSDIAKSLSQDGVWINQLNDSPTMIRRNAFDAIVHEHLCYYDIPALSRMYARHGLVIDRVTVNEVNGGSVRVFARRIGSMLARDAGVTSPTVSFEEAQAFARRTKRWREQMRAIVDSDLMRYAPLWGYGASTKLGVLLGYLGRNEAFIGIADRNAAKWGKRMGGTGIPITSEIEFRAAQPGYVLVGPWAFRDEFVERERGICAAGATLLFPLPDISFVV
jgi:NDP-4-keto-2,6-dideoxyhexose 3-C-methyltransferase